MIPKKMNRQAAFADFYRGRRVLVTGHTGFKGAWLCEWLLELGAEVTGMALAPETSPSLFEQLDLERRLRHHVGDVRDADAVNHLLRDVRPDVVFHLAAQPLVRRSYAEPTGTYETNVIGTMRILDALRGLDHPCAALVITSDKCYENTGRLDGYREQDPLGGHDPYSSSKACAEILVSSYRRSFFSAGAAGASPVRLAAARAGNVIGGGDWATDRIVPDCIRSLMKDQPIQVRNRHAVRPWQHVLEPLGGYLLLASRLHPEADLDVENDRREFDAFNFGPSPAAHRTVEDLVEEVLLHWPGRWVDQTLPDAPHEASVLTLDISKARRLLGWQPRWSFEAAITETIYWYRTTCKTSPEAVAEVTREQIRRYQAALGKTSPAAGRRRAAPLAHAKPA